MANVVKQVLQKKTQFKAKVDHLALQVALLVTLPFMSVSAHASAMGKVAALLEEWKVELYSALGVGSFIYVMVAAIQAKLGAKRWSDVGMAMFHVAIAGSVMTAVPFCWAFFNS